MKAASIRAVLTLVVGIAITAAVVLYLPIGAEAAIPALGITSVPVGEAVFTGIVFGALLLAGVVGGLLTGVNALKPGHWPLSMLWIGLFVGLFGVTVTTGYAGIVGSLKVGEAVRNSAAMLALGAATVFIQAAAEEVYFRGWVQPVLAKAWGPGPAIVLASLAFAVLHVLGGARTPLTLVNLFLGGLLFGMLAAYGRGLLGAVAAHFAWNGAEQLILGLDPNPGVGSFGSVFNFELVGAQSWGGSEEGLNASFAMTLTLFAVVIPAFLLVRRQLASRPAR